MARMLAVEPGTHEFDRRARQGNLVPVSCEVIADLETPISAYLRLRDLPHPFLLESVEGGEKVARYSFLGAQPQLLINAFASHVLDQPVPKAISAVWYGSGSFRVVRNSSL